MAGRKKDPARTEATRTAILEKAYELFVIKSIEAVSMIEIAKECGYGTITVYRYFSTKTKLVVAVAIWKWSSFLQLNQQRRLTQGDEAMTAAQLFDFYLDSFLELYRNYRDLLRFNQLFNVYVQSAGADAETMQPYQEMIRALAGEFHEMYEKARQDHTFRTDIPEQEVFSTTLHLMLAATTRYAIGLVYQPEGGPDPERELITLKELLLEKYLRV